MKRVLTFGITRQRKGSGESVRGLDEKVNRLVESVEAFYFEVRCSPPSHITLEVLRDLNLRLK